jgi:hypothetical protein
MLRPADQSPRATGKNSLIHPSRLQIPRPTPTAARPEIQRKRPPEKARLTSFDNLYAASYIAG